MTTTLKDKVRTYKAKEQEIISIQEKIRELERQYIIPLKEKQKQKQDALLQLGNQELVSISVGELVKELSDLTGIKEENMHLDIDYIDMWTTKDIKESINNQVKKPQLRLIISSNEPKNLSKMALENGEFYYYLIFESNFSEPQFDGKTLLEHSYTLSKYTDNLSWPSLYIKKEDIMNIICHFKLNELAKLNTNSDINLLEEALDNYMKKQERIKIKKKH